MSLSESDFSLQEMQIAHLFGIFGVGERGDETLHLLCFVQIAASHVLSAEPGAENDFRSERFKIVESVRKLSLLGAQISLPIRQDGEPQMDAGCAQRRLLILQDGQALIEAFSCACKSPVIHVEQSQRPQAVFPCFRLIQHGCKDLLRFLILAILNEEKPIFPAGVSCSKPVRIQLESLRIRTAGLGALDLASGTPSPFRYMFWRRLARL